MTMRFAPFHLALAFMGLLVAETDAVGAERQSFQVAAADCYAIGQQVAAENGGTLARATSVSRGDDQVCVIVILVPGKDGERPRRAEFEVPAD